MDNSERVFALNYQGAYSQTSRNSAHPSIVKANSKMVKLDYIKCHQIFKGESFFKDPQTEEFYNRSRSTPNKLTMSKSYNSGVSTHLTNSYRQRDNSLQIQKGVLLRNDKQSNYVFRHTRNNSDHLQPRIVYEQAKRFQLPMKFQTQNKSKIETTQNQSKHLQSTINRSQYTKKSIENEISVKLKQQNIITPQKIMYAKIQDTPSTKNIQNSPNCSIDSYSYKIDNTSLKKQQYSDNRFKKYIFSTPPKQPPCYQSTAKNQIVQKNKTNVVRRVIYTPQNRQTKQHNDKPSQPRYNSPSVIKYEDMRSNKYKSGVILNSNCSQYCQQINQKKIHQNKLSLEQKVRQLQRQLLQKQKQIKDCQRNLVDSQNRQKLMKSQLDKVKVHNYNDYSNYHGIMCNNRNQNQINMKVRDWGQQIRKDLSKEGNQKSALFLFTLFMVLLCKQTIN